MPPDLKINLAIQADLRPAVGALLAEASRTLIMPRFRTLASTDIDTKSSAQDLVTIADIEAEAWLTPRLVDLLPGSLAVGEEAVSRGEADLAVLHGPDPVWVIDPVDGTSNFAQGKEGFCTMVALIHLRRVLAGWIYLPLSDQLYWAGQGQGSICAAGGGDGPAKALRIQDPTALVIMSHRFFARPYLKGRRHAVVAALAPTRPTLCAGLDYIAAATGDCGVVAMASLMPWDHAAGTLLVQEAGGAVDLNGGKYDPTVGKGTLLAGGHKGRLAQVRDLLIDDRAP